MANRQVCTRTDIGILRGDLGRAVAGDERLLRCSDCNLEGLAFAGPVGDKNVLAIDNKLREQRCGGVNKLGFGTELNVLPAVRLSAMKTMT